MDIQTTLNDYKLLGEYFAPDYERENEVLSSFKRNNPTLSKQQTTQLTELLSGNDIYDKYFVADLLYLYDIFDYELLEPLLISAINHKDPSFNRIFLRPCITAFGTKTVADFLADKFRKGDILQHIGIANLIYWLSPQENGEADHLHQIILEQASKTENLIELYYYKLRYQHRVKGSNRIPNDATELMEAIKGNEEYENILFEKLNWARG